MNPNSLNNGADPSCRFQVSTEASLFQTKVNISSYQRAVNVSVCEVLFLSLTAPYKDLQLTVNNTANSATCTAHGGFPEAQVSWTGQNKSRAAQLDLQHAETFLQEDPTEKTFTVTSSVSVKELQSVTCYVYNPRSNQRIHSTSQIDAPGECRSFRENMTPENIFDEDTTEMHFFCVCVLIET